ncbi:sugar-transfer associated ATP-grasp domain-containing protein [Bacillus alkalicola]|uniref:Alpha-L-glutamate ligase-related protein ATP-grasp domain-containing protein n=2 Tax=Bacillaceae TaxID=186817 RepID=A0ABS6JVZ2_9BACI|nr:sugar-transfer associated ATP-grasp domain-containing protein [Bacillus alkalicola]MBU9722721.1 hypothetical protein [Bacillus alkalicola]
MRISNENKSKLDNGNIYNQQSKLDTLGIDSTKKVYSALKDKIDVTLIDEEYINDVQRYWEKRMGIKIDPVFHIYMQQNFNIKNKFFLPEVQYRLIQKSFNESKKTGAYTDKNLYDQIVKTNRQPKIYLKCVNQRYFINVNIPIKKTQITTHFNNIKDQSEFIIKPSRSANGRKVSKLIFDNNNFTLNNRVVSISELEDLYGKNFVIQELITQHSLLKSMHPSSVNTIRMLTFRWNNDITHLMSFLRIGIDGAINDNAGTGGICIGVQDDGKLNSLAVDESGNKWLNHPTTNFSFQQETFIPNFQKFKEFVIDLHHDILHHDLVSWDIAVGDDGEP